MYPLTKSVLILEDRSNRKEEIMRKFLKSLAFILSIFMLAGCRSGAENAENSASNEKDTYRIGVVTDRAKEIWEDAVNRLPEEADFDVEIVLFNDFVQPNIALAEGEIDANAYQYIPFLYEYNRSQEDENLVPMGYLSVEIMGLWGADGIDSIEDVPEGAQVAITNDPVNMGNGLVQLENAGLIKLREGSGATPTPNDIVENPKELTLEPLQGSQVARALGDVELMQTGTTMASEAGHSLEEAIYLAEPNEVSHLFRLNFVTREGIVDDPNLQMILDTYQSKETVDYAISTSEAGTFSPGWENDDNATEQYKEYAESENVKQE